jgi:hypothetical protein
VTWFKDNKQVENSDRIKIESNETLASLEIATALSTDQAQYHALASNSKGEVIASFSLNVAFDANSASLDVKEILGE